MIVKNYSYARQNLKSLMTKVNDDSDVVTVTSSDDKNVVIMSEADYNSIIETLYLQQNSNNAEHLAQSIADLERGKMLTKEIDV
ncbi:type II toxin-antitoxin system Phd/YefM family antitoxin [Staphylococcus argenteus]|uniref:type II toxin-antitoxin system Phd/YefM family antitoxin n=1 Tax=Staphylococcus argenteus TaxID=985002 RepID=UPI000500381A|nr:type II toxin-antitoxin system Phd/YefM family antitoxin [Staphylococcus argenteus]API80317.1 prevent-host-death protein [Staphylococcus argenteus]MBE2122978.1 type II toxin-antitoxin system Phd/YefM family antitoxin [Staphylococcus argenteus]MBE2141414.1 type II toxin-antitoxin system Phd/YefM family antitoxin [Staphylococcus argenteus]MCG6477287.1 type II toxin-antitoxin system Phd/YefM family antitoxin [Staphylococcus argenteus]MCG9803824.1 type II toxin-antitoxin system Phd/YefM family 